MILNKKFKTQESQQYTTHKMAIGFNCQHSFSINDLMIHNQQLNLNERQQCNNVWLIN